MLAGSKDAYKHRSIAARMWDTRGDASESYPINSSIYSDLLLFWCGLLVLACAKRREALGHAVGCGDKEVAGAAGGVDYLEVEDRLLALGRCLFEDGVERGVEQT